MNIQNQMEKMYEEGKQEAPPSSVMLACYGCEHMCASPVSCDHPVGMTVRWDPVRNRVYRMPSVELCVSEGGVCRFYDPDALRGAGAGAVQKRKQKAKVTKIDEVLDQIDDDDVPIEEFLENLKNLDEEMTREERGEEGDDND
jgi:hypothetical protein